MNRYHSDEQKRFQQHEAAAKRKERLILLCLLVVVIAASLLLVSLAGDAVIPICPAEIYTKIYDLSERDTLDITTDSSVCGEFLCISISKMLFIKYDEPFLLAIK